MREKLVCPQKERQGSVLITLLIVVLLVSVAGAALVGFAKQQAFSVGQIRDYLTAQAYAEAGANEAYSLLKSDFALREDPSKFPARTFGNGSYDADVTPVGNSMAVITCVGSHGAATAVVKLDVKNYTEATGGGGGPAGAYGYAIVSEGDMTWSGSGEMQVAGLIHSGGALKTTGSEKFNVELMEARGQFWSTGSTEINGDATAPSWKGKSPGNVTGTALTDMPPVVALPQIDLMPYYYHAEANGQVYNGNQHFMGSSEIVIPGGIMWVNGNFKYSGSGNIVGCIIATGDIDISGSGDQIKVDDYPALISSGGDLDISGSGMFHGLLYAMNGEFDKSGSGDVVGSIFCKGEFKKSGSWEVMTYEESTPVPPGGGGGGTSGDLVGVSAWQK